MVTQIVRPVTKTIISTTGWGIPVTDALNGLLAARVIAGKQQNISQTGLANNVWTSVTGMSISFTAKANWLYEIGWQANCAAGSTPGLWMACGLQVDGSGAPGRFVSTTVSSQTATGYGMACFGRQLCSSKLGGVLAAGTHTLQLQATAAGAAMSIDAGAPCYVYVADWGADS